MIGSILFLAFIILPLACYFGALAAHPVRILGKVFSTPAETARLAVLLGRTVGIAALAATLALAAGALILIALQSAIRNSAFRIPHSAFILLAALPFFLPGTVSAIAWIQAFGQAGWVTQGLAAAHLPSAWLPAALYSSAGCALALALHDYPIVLALAWLGWRGVGRAALESGATLMPPGRLWRGLLLGWLRPWLAAGWLLVFMRALHEYSIPLLLRQHVFSVEIVSAFNVYYDTAQAMALALPLVALGLAGAALLGRLLARVRWPADPGRPAGLPLPSSRARWILAALAALWVIPAAAVPLSTLFKMAGGWHTYSTILVSAREQIQSSLLTSTIAAAGSVILVFWIMGPIRPIRPIYPSLLIGAMIFALIGLPGSIAGMAQIAFWNRRGWGGVPARFFDSGAVLPLGLLVLALPVVWVILRSRLRQTPRVLIETQALQPLGPWRGWWRLTAPRLARPALVAGGLAFVLSLHEAQASLLLAAPGQETMSIRAMTLLHNAPDSLVAAFCLVLVALIAAGLGALWGAGCLIDRLNRRFA